MNGCEAILVGCEIPITATDVAGLAACGVTKAQCEIRYHGEPVVLMEVGDGGYTFNVGPVA